MMLLSNYIDGHEIGFAVDEQVRSSERVCGVAMQRYTLSQSG